MITNKEIQAIKLSPTKKDFYQIWSELLDLAGKLSERWDPTASNESDPGIVLLKVLTAVADKLNYSTDKNILEAFMPSAAQMDSMRKLCEMMGYNIKYYQSAETDLAVSYDFSSNSDIQTFALKKGTTFTNIDEDLIYTYIGADKIFSLDSGQGNVYILENVIQGTLENCKTTNDNIITIDLIDDNNRYYLPENQIAENGIYVTNTNGDSWEKVENLNTEALNKHVFKFGFDSAKNRPYIQFPEDISILIKDGLKIDYIRTNGIDGNVSRGMITKVQAIISDVEGIDTDSFTVINHSAATNGRNIETIRQAYKGFKKTVGTFNTLVTCRDYMNVIYNSGLVSNVLVTDIRTDINNAIEICSYNNFGICYTPVSLKDDSKDKIDHFDLMLYPFTKIESYDSDSYNNSFKLDASCFEDIAGIIKENKTIAHILRYPNVLNNSTDIACIKNYLKLNAKISTIYKVSAIEEKLILFSIKNALCARFNMHELEFGEEIPFDDILDCIENADERIKSVSLEEPELYTAVYYANNKEYLIAGNSSSDLTISDSAHNELVLRNVLSGRVSLFDYNTTYTTNYLEKSLSANTLVNQTNTDWGKIESTGIATQYITDIETEWNPDLNSLPLTLEKNQVLKFVAPNYRTEITYPAYVNYYFKFNATGDEAKEATPTLITETITSNADLSTFLESHKIAESDTYDIIPEIYIKLNNNLSNKKGYLVDSSGWKYKKIDGYRSDIDEYYYFETEVQKGQNEILAYVSAGEEYKLQEGEFLIVEYTPSSTDSSEPASSITKEYGHNDIIKPSFLLADTDKASGTKTKKIIHKGHEYNVLTLGANEQIEIRKVSKVDLYNPTNKEGLTGRRNINICLLMKNYNKLENNYVLKEDEYLFYTDSNQQELAYYGPGTKITTNTSGQNNLLNLLKSDANVARFKENSIESILNNGISAIKTVKCSIEEGNLVLEEQQYKTLTEGAELTSLIALPDSDLPDSDDIKYMSAEWKLKDGTTGALPKIYSGWSLEKILVLNTGPDTEQKLHQNEKITLKYNTINNELIELTDKATDVVIELEPGITNSAYLKSSITLNSTTGNVDVASMFTTTIKGTTAKTNPITLELKAFDLDEPNIITANSGSDETLVFNNDDFTKILTREIKTEGIKLNANIPNNTYGLIAVVYNTSKDEESTITVSAPTITSTINGSQLSSISIFNSGDPVSNTLSLNQGLNVIKIDGSSTLTINVDQKDKTSTILIGTLDLVSGLNQKILQYKKINEADADTQLLKDIKAKEDETGIPFYYNCPINKNKELNINYDLADDIVLTNTLKDPRTYYDPNNINNKFVISEIDLDYINKGITVAKSSKL